MQTHPKAGTTMTAPSVPLFRSLRRDWLSWSRTERISAIGILLGASLSAAFALGVQA